MKKEIKKIAKQKRNYKNPKEQITLRLRPETIDWFRQHPGYHTMISDVLDEYVATVKKRKTRKN